MKKILYIILFVFCLIGKSNGQVTKKLFSAGYIYSYSQKLNPMTGFSIGYIPRLVNSQYGYSVFHKFELSWSKNNSTPNNDIQDQVFNISWSGSFSIIDFSRRNHIYGQVGISTGIIRLYEGVLFNPQTDSYNYSIRNKLYIGFPVRVEWGLYSRIRLPIGLFIYGNFHRYKDFGGGVNLYFGKVK